MYPLLFIGLYYTFIFEFWQLPNSHEGGTVYTVDYAKRNGLEFFLIGIIANIQHGFYVDNSLSLANAKVIKTEEV